MASGAGNLAIGLVALALTLGHPAAAAQPLAPNPSDRCSGSDPSSERACIGRRIAGKEREMGRLYARALTAVRASNRRHGQEDGRTGPDFLRRSQAAWRQFVDSNCTVRAAYGGGSNSSISDRETACREAELDGRIAFLRQLATGSGMFGP
jgi:uncharacterized protein YecT (DUF1311 family)